jgi:hypothetical protein
MFSGKRFVSGFIMLKNSSAERGRQRTWFNLTATEGHPFSCQRPAISNCVLFLLPAFVAAQAHGATPFPSEKGTLWKYQMTQEFGEGVRPSSGTDQVGSDGKLRLPVEVYAAGTERIDGVDTVKYETHRLGVVALVEYLAVSEAGVTAYARAGEDGDKYKVNPPQKVFAFPIRAGEKWTYKGKAADIDTEQNYEVVGAETVEVPAGRFDTFHLRVTQLSPLPPDITEDRWFVPNVGYVKIVTEMKRADGALLERINLELKERPKIAERPLVSVGPSAKKALGAVLAKELTGEATTTFPPNHPKIYLRWQGEALQKGDKIRSVWIAEDVGDVAPKNYKLDEVSMTADGPRAFGTFTITKPNKGWPVGKYRVDLYRGDEVMETLKFEIAK